MIFTHPRCLQCFPTQENSNQRPSTLKLPPLISQVFLSWSSLSKSTKNTYIAVFSCQNRATFCQIVTRLLRTTQGTTNLTLKTCPASRKSCHDWTLRKHAHDIAKSWHACKIVSRFSFFTDSFLSHFATGKNEKTIILCSSQFQFLFYIFSFSLV